MNKHLTRLYVQLTNRTSREDGALSFELVGIAVILAAVVVLIFTAFGTAAGTASTGLQTIMTKFTTGA